MSNLAAVEAHTQFKENKDWPVPVGWRILVDPATPKTVTEAGIILSSETQLTELYNNYVGLVVAMGPLCYKHDKFGGCEPWCKVGDWIAYGQHAGQSITVRDQSVMDEIEKKRAEARKVEDQVFAVNGEISAKIGMGKESTKGLIARRDTLQNRRVEIHTETLRLEEHTERRLRLLNDDEVLSLIPNKNAIKIYI